MNFENDKSVIHATILELFIGKTMDGTIVFQVFQTFQKDKRALKNIT